MLSSRPPGERYNICSVKRSLSFVMLNGYDDEDRMLTSLKLKKFQSKRGKPHEGEPGPLSPSESEPNGTANALDDASVPTITAIASPMVSKDLELVISQQQQPELEKVDTIFGGMVSAVANGDGANLATSPMYIMRHVEKRTVRTKVSDSSLAEAREKKLQADKMTAAVMNGIENEIQLHERFLQNSIPNITNPDSNILLSDPSSNSLILHQDSSQPIAFPTDSYVKSLEDQLTKKNAQIVMFRNMIAGSSDLFQQDLEMEQDLLEQVENDPSLLKGWLHQLRFKVKELEATPQPHIKSVTSSSGFSTPVLKESQSVQTEDTDISEAIGAMETEISFLTRALRERDFTLKVLSEESAAMQIKLLELETQSDMNAVNTATNGTPGAADAEVVQSLRDRCESLAGQLEACMDERDRDRVVFATKEQELLRSSGAMAHRLRDLEANYKAACDRRDILQREVNNLKASKKSNPHSSEGLGRKVEVLTRNIEAASRENREMAQENRELKTRIEAWEADPLPKKLQAELEAARATIQELGEGNSKLQSELGELKEGGASQWREERLRFQEELARLRDAVVSNGGNEGKLRVEVEELKGLLEAAGSEKENLRADKVKLLRETESLKSERNNLVERSTELEKRLRLLERATNEEVEAWRKALKEENDGLKEEKIKLTRELELFKARHVELENKVKTLKKEVEDSPSEEEIAKLSVALESINAERQTLSVSLVATQTSLETVTKELEAVKAERDALADGVHEKTPISENDLMLERTAMMELVATLRLQCDELAKQAHSSKVEAVTAKEALDTVKRTHSTVDDNVLGQVSDLETQLELTSERLKRDKDTWKAKEQNLYKEIERLHLDYMDVTNEVNAARKMILESRMAPGGLSQHIVKVEDVSVEDWVRNIIVAYKKQQNDLVEAHTILDLQHEKLEDAIIRSSISAESLAAFNAGSRSGAVTKVDQQVQTDPTGGLSRMNSVMAALNKADSLVLSGTATPRSRASSIASSHGQGPIQTVPPGSEGPPLPPTLEVSQAQTSESAQTSTQGEEMYRTALSKLTAKYATLQQQHAAVASQLEHQLRSNSEIKRLLVGATVGAALGGSQPGSRKGSEANLGEPNLLEKYNDALLEIGGLRTELEKWRLRCEEVEEVVEQVFLKQMEGLEKPLDEEE
ncbi:hypothetical protein HDU97_001230 [Phlyctochytrium planicorne]|nr:hypothetical protein HDU97_001230 [Phlyctochytrium planicorne]